MFKRLIVLFIIVSFILSYYQPIYAQDFNVNDLPVPGSMVGESEPFTPLALKGLVINPKKPLEFQFIVDTGNSLPNSSTVIPAKAGIHNQEQLNQQLNQLVKYFLAGLTIPEGDLWVNLSPYEKTRVVPEALGQTDLGRDLLAQDYTLKQLTSSLIYPEKDLGKEFWSKVYSKALQQFGTTNIPVNTFNKVWILPDQAQVFEHGAAAYVTKATLKVMLDQDYLAMQKHSSVPPLFYKEGVRGSSKDINKISSQIIRSIILPEITKEVNTGKNLAPLRQIYQALILAKWYKETIQNGLLDAIYTNKNKVIGINLNDPAIKEQIYERYLKAYKKGAFNYIKEAPTPNGQVVPRKYFSGGISNLELQHVETDGSAAMISHDGAMISLTVKLLLAASVPVALAAYALHQRRQIKKIKEEIVKLLKHSEIAHIEDSKVTIHETNTPRLSEERALLEINEALDQKKLTPDFKKSWDTLSKHMSQFGLGFAPMPKSFMELAARLGNFDGNVLHADTREIDPISEFKGIADINDQVYLFGWDGLDKQRQRIWVVFPKSTDGAMKVEDEGRTKEPLILDGYLSALNYRNWLLNLRKRKLIKQLNDPVSNKAELLQKIEPVRRDELYNVYKIPQGTVSQLNQILIEILKNPVPVLQQLAIRALAKSGDLEAIECLIPFLSDERFRMDAVWSIAQIFCFEILIKPYASKKFIETLGDRKEILVVSLTAYIDRFDINMHKKDYSSVLLPVVMMADKVFDIRHIDHLLRLKIELERYRSSLPDLSEKISVLINTVPIGMVINDIERKHNENSRAQENNRQGEGAMNTMPGGIDLNQINVKRTGKTINVRFDPAQLNELEQSDFKGFTPVITGFRYIQSPFPLLGILPKDPKN